MNAIIGQPLDRRDGALKVTGRAAYAAEFPVADLVHAVLVCSTIGAGDITGFDLAAAKAMPGVLAIVTPDNAPRIHADKAAPQTITAPLLQDSNVIYHGQPIAIVVADMLDRAMAAAAAVRVAYQPGAVVADMADQLEDAYVPQHFRDGERPPDSKRGDPDSAFQSAAVKLDTTYVTPFEHHNPMEPHATIARWDGDNLTVWTATQGISGAQATFAALFGIDPANVRVICPFVGGGFGSKGNTWMPASLAVMAARMVNRPVKLVLTRAQMYTNNGYRPMTIQHLRVASDKDGKLQAITHAGFSSMSQPSLGEYSEPVALPTEMIYACPNVAVLHRLVALNAPLPTYMRAPGESAGMYALEVAMDELAVAAGIDPLELRLRNYAETDEHENKPFASKKLRECYTQAAAAFGWSRRNPQPRATKEGRELIGWGMATATYPTNRRAASARVRLGADGTALIQSGTQDLGTGTYTVIAQIAAQELGLPVNRVKFQLGDSAFPPAPVSGGSQTVASVGPAVQQACRAAKAQILDMAARDKQLGWPPVDAKNLTFDNFMVSGPSGKVGLAELLAHRGTDALVVSSDATPGDTKSKYSLHAFGAQFAEVRVDPDLGTIRVTRLVGAFDCGRLMNAKTAHSQLIGGMTFGIGMALLEATYMDDRTGQFVNHNIAEYLLPVNADVPAIEAIVVANDELVSNPLGAKGIGELPLVGVAAALANAVYHATGKRLRKLPIRIEDVLDM